MVVFVSPESLCIYLIKIPCVYRGDSRRSVVSPSFRQVKSFQEKEVTDGRQVHFWSDGFRSYELNQGLIDVAL